MSRHTSYTPEQDAILLSHRSIGDVVAEFAKRGWPARSHGALIQRRLYLQKQGRTTNYQVGELVRRRERLIAQQEGLARQVLKAQQRTHELQEALLRIETNLSVLDEALDGHAETSRAGPTG